MKILFKAVLAAALLSGFFMPAVRADWGSTNLDKTIYAAAYGVVCDGVTDTTANLQTAINASQGLRLRLPQGNCLFSSTITIGGTTNPNNAYNNFFIEGYGNCYGVPAGSNTCTQLVWTGSRPTITVTTLGSGTTITASGGTTGCQINDLATDTTTPANLGPQGGAGAIIVGVGATTLTLQGGTVNTTAVNDVIACNHAGLSVQMRDSIIRNLSIVVQSGKTLGVGIQSCSAKTSAPTVTPTGNTYDNLSLDGISGGLIRGIAWQVCAGDVDGNNDINVLNNLKIFNYCTTLGCAALSIEHTQSKKHYIAQFQAGSSGTAPNVFTNYGITTVLGNGLGGSFSLHGGSLSFNGIDFMLGAVDDEIVIADGSSEDSNQFLVTKNSASQWPVRVIGWRFADNNFEAGTPYLIDFEEAGGLDIESSTIADTCANAAQMRITASPGNGEIRNSLFCSTAAQASAFKNWSGNDNIQVHNVFGAGGLSTALWPDLNDVQITNAAITSTAGTCGNGLTAGTMIGDQSFFHITCGASSVSTFTITWPRTRLAAPKCFVTPYASAQAAGLVPAVNNTTTLTMNWTTAAANTQWDVQCIGQ